jgi:hypothetical protein
VSKFDIRDHLTSIAAGKDPRLAAVLAGAVLLNPEVVRKHQPVYRAWDRFVRECIEGHGEPRAAAG